MNNPSTEDGWLTTSRDIHPVSIALLYLSQGSKSNSAVDVTRSLVPGS